MRHQAKTALSGLATAMIEQPRLWLSVAVVVSLTCHAPPAEETRTPAEEVERRVQALAPSGFSDQVIFSGRTNPIAVRFASNGRVFVAEEAGRIYFYDNLSDTTATLFADLRSQVNSYWDRGLLGFALDPNYASNGHVYVLYSHDTATNPENGQSVANRNGTDNCPSPPGGTSQGCVTFGRLARMTDPGSGYPISAQLTLITEWPQQFPSHSIGGLNFGPDGNLYATGGDGASFNTTDYGQFGIPKNPLGDPPAPVGGNMTAPTARGGALRSQSFRRPSGENVTLNGSLIRINPGTGAGASGNPNLSHPDVDAKRLIAVGLRNPYRFTFHPVTGDIWIGDVGANDWEEINRLPAPVTGSPMKNYGWPCYEGTGRHGGWDGLNMDMCEAFYSSGVHTAPYFTYAHGQPVYSGDACADGGSAVSGLAFYPPSGGNYPANYRNALFFADIGRDCIYVVFPGTNGLPNNASRTNFIVAAGNPVDLQIGPNNDLFYVDYGGGGGTGTDPGSGTIHRVRFQAPTAVATANPTSGFAPLTVNFNGSMSTPGSPGDTLSYAWDLDGDGAYDDSTAANPSRTYSTQGTIATRLRVTDQNGASDESDPINIVVGSNTTPPEPVIDTPSASLTWKVGDTISFSGHATDDEDGNLPASSFIWQIIIQHCPTAACHPHLVQSFDGVASGSFPAPDHEYPSHLQIQLTVTDSHGLQTTVTRELQPQTVSLTFQTSPTASPGLQLGFNLESAAAPFSRTVIVGSFNGISAPNQSRGSTLYTFQSWSDGGPQTHDIVAPATATTYTATFQTSTSSWTSQDIGAVAPPPGTWSESGGVHTIEGGGADIWGTADEFRFVYQQLSGDVTITARVTELENTHAFAKAGVMMRQTSSAGSINFHCLASPIASSKFRFIRRTSTGATSVAEVGPDSPLPGAPAWVRLVRAGDTFKCFTSLNGSTFTQLGTTQTLSMGTSILVGMAVTSHLDGTLATAKFDNVSLVTGPAPSPWSSQDVGAVGAAGSSSQSGGTHTVVGAGADIWGTADEFHYRYQNVTGNATIIARVASIQNVNTWSKAGVMIRNGLTAGAANVMMLATPTSGNFYRWQVRSASGGSTTSTPGGAGTRPVYLRIVRNASTLTGSYSANGSTWTQLGSVTISMASTVQIGLAVTSHVDATLATGVFDTVSITTP